jgi:hypothetical protein
MSDPITNSVYEALAGEDRILVHWLCYITDRQRPYEEVWEHGGYWFSRLISEYRKGPRTTAEVKALLGRHAAVPAGGKVPQFSEPRSREKPFAPRYQSDYDAVERTLVLLLDHDKSLVSLVRRWSTALAGHDDALYRLAHVLYVLTYNSRISVEVARGLLLDGRRLTLDYEGWRTRPERFVKRLWAALRDYRKPGSPFAAYIEEYSPWPQSHFELEQLELPGDMWNIRFFDVCVLHLAREGGLPIMRRTSHRPAPEVARLIYERVTGSGVHFYPEQLDVSFDFAPRMCDRKLCGSCLFHKSGASEFCLGETELVRVRPCPILFYSAGYKVPCEPKDCPVVQEASRNLCRGLV